MKLKTMAFLILAMMLAAQCFALAAAKTIIIKKDNGGEAGYYYITELHDESFDKLLCSDPGFQSCRWLSSPNGKLIGYAEGQIAIGNYAGTYTMVDANIRYTVTWTWENAQNSMIQETQEPISSIE
jgi:hypothetical protein